MVTVHRPLMEVAVVTLHTKKGDFPSFAELRYAYFKQNEDMRLDPKHVDTNEWQSELLHASEVGACPRMQMLRISGAPKKIKANLTLATEELMFRVAYFVHYAGYEAMAWAGILVDHEVPLMEPPWAGRADALFTPDFENPDDVWLYDAKTTRMGAFKYTESLPKEPHCLQLGAYGTALPDITNGVVEYIDRSGSVPAIECVVDLTKWEVPAQERMDALEQYREALPELPPMMPESFVAHYRKARNQPFKELASVTYDCSWQCSWCAFHHTNTDDTTRPDSPCKPPNHAPIEVAKVRTQKEGGGWAYNAAMAAGMNVSGIQQIIATFTPRVPIIGGGDEE